MDKIDVVITWVDGNDPKWQQEKACYEDIPYISDERIVRYRDWDNLQYIFRGIENYMPWVNTVHFVTWGHLPRWMNTQCPKLHIVNHKDFIPKKYLPTFNSNTIELNMHRISGLAEKYINFNDDMFVIGEVKPEDFFEYDLPKDMAILSPQPINRGGIANTVINNLEILNDHFGIENIKENKRKWFTVKYGKMLIRNIIFFRFHTIIGIFEPHIPLSHLKSTALEVWKKEEKVLDLTCMHKFRSKEDVNVWLLRGWQLLSGNFVPRRSNFGSYRALSGDMDSIIHLLHNPGKIKLICINDIDSVEDFEGKKNKLNAVFQEIFPKKSEFEI